MMSVANKTFLYEMSISRINMGFASISTLTVTRTGDIFSVFKSFVIPLYFQSGVFGSSTFSNKDNDIFAGDKQ
jgi:hypothetical protein